MTTIQYELTTYHEPQEDALPAELVHFENASTPSVAAILLHTSCCLLNAATVLYLMHWVYGYDLVRSSLLTVCVLVGVFGLWGVLCSLITGSRAMAQNLGWGCGLLVVTLVFFGVCGFVGALVAVALRLPMG